MAEGTNNCVFCSNWIRTLVAMLPLTYNLGKVEIGLYCYLTADILTKVLQKCSLSSPLPNVCIVSEPLNVIDCHGNQKAKFVEKY